MIYAVSDLHGSFDKFQRLLKEIRFSDNDLMYVVGDIVDYGEQSIELLTDLSMRYNVISIVGDHDLRAFRLLTELDKMLKGEGMPEPEVLSEMTQWIQDGGQSTMEGFKALDEDMKEGILEYLEDMTLYEEVEAGGKKYLLLHAGIADFDGSPLEDYMPEDFINQPLDLNAPLIDGVTLVVGHIPTYEIDGAQRGKIYHGEGSIAIDCGAAFGEPLACLCLNNGKEYYIYD